MQNNTEEIDFPAAESMSIEILLTESKSPFRLKMLAIIFYVDIFLSHHVSVEYQTSLCSDWIQQE